MGRHPLGDKARQYVLGIRVTPEERKQFDVQRWKKGDLTRAEYLRALMAEDAKRLKGDNGNG